MLLSPNSDIFRTVTLSVRCVRMAVRHRCHVFKVRCCSDCVYVVLCARMLLTCECDVIGCGIVCWERNSCILQPQDSGLVAFVLNVLFDFSIRVRVCVCVCVCACSVWACSRDVYAYSALWLYISVKQLSSSLCVIGYCVNSAKRLLHVPYFCPCSE
jgi:hypothetical protein